MSIFEGNFFLQMARIWDILLLKASAVPIGVRDDINLGQRIKFVICKTSGSPTLTVHLLGMLKILLFTKCSRSANTSYILATSCDSILERCGIYRNHHLLFMLDKLSVTEVINPNPGFIPAHLAVLSWVLRSLPLLSPATIWLRLQRRTRFRNYIVLIWMV